MATAITLKSESADYYTKVFDNNADKFDVEEYIQSIGEDMLYLIGYDSTDGRIGLIDVQEIISSLEEEE